MSKSFFESVLPTMSKEQMQAAFNQVILEGDEECKQLAIEDPIANYKLN